MEGSYNGIDCLFLNCSGCPDAQKFHTAEGSVHLLLKIQSSAQITNINKLLFNVINDFQATAQCARDFTRFFAHLRNSLSI